MFQRGEQRGSRKAVANNTGADAEFFDIDNNPNWYAIAVFNRDNIGNLHRDWDIKFTSEVVGKVIAYEPTPKMQKQILRIFVQLGGRCDPRIQAIYF